MDSNVQEGSFSERENKLRYHRWIFVGKPAVGGGGGGGGPFQNKNFVKIFNYNKYVYGKQHGPISIW